MKIKKRSVFLISLFIFFSIGLSTVSAASYTVTLEEYQAEAQRILDKYDMTEQMHYHLFTIPNKTLSEYSIYMEEMVSRTAYVFQVIDSHKQKQISPPIAPRVIYIKRNQNAI